MTPKKSFFIVLRCHGHRPGNGGTASSSTVPCAPSVQVTFQTTRLSLYTPTQIPRVTKKPIPLKKIIPPKKTGKNSVPVAIFFETAQVAAGARDHDGPAPLCQSGAQWNAPRSAAGTACRRPGAETTPLWALCDPAPL